MTLTWQNPISTFPGWLMMLARAGSASRGPEGAAAVDFPESDAALMLRLRNGDQHAFTELFDKWKRPLISFFYRSTGDYHLAEDMTLEVASKVYRARERYQPKARFSTWLFQIATNHLRDAWRRKNPSIRLSEDGDSLPEWAYPETPDPIDAQKAREWEQWLIQALVSVPESEKTALLLVAQQGMTPSEAAEAMSLTANHVRVLLNKARNRLKAFRMEES